MLAILKSGNWITRERMRLWSLAVLAASLGGLVFLVATSDGLNDYQGRPLGTDFSNIYAGGTYVLDGQPGTAFDPPSQHARQQMIFGKDTPFYGWCYPPFLLFVAAGLALMPYLAALAVWQASTFILYLLMLRAILSASWPAPPPYPPPQAGEGKGAGVDARQIGEPQVRSRASSTRYGDAVLRTARGKRSDAVLRMVMAGHDSLWILLAVASPAVFVNLGHGHNGFLTAALMGAALLVLDRKPVLAGVLFGLMSYKPQFGMMIPLVLVATGRWRAFASASATVLALVAISTLAFGIDVWRMMMDAMPFTREVVLEQGGTGWHKIQSAFSWTRMWGGGIPLAYAMQGAVTLAVGGALVWLWRSAAAFALKAAALPIASILATPYSLDYDLVALAPSIAFLAGYGMSRGFRDYEKTALALLWFMPLIARTLAEQTLIPLAVPSMFVVLLLMLRRAAEETGALGRWHPAAQPLK